MDQELNQGKVRNTQGSPYTPTRVPDFLKETRFRRRGSYALIIASINLLLQAGNEGKAEYGQDYITICQGNERL